MDAVLGDVVVDVSNVTSWLEIPAVGVKIIMCHSLLDANTESHTLMGKSVDGIHKVGVIGRQSVRVGHAFKEWARRVETWITQNMQWRTTVLQRNHQRKESKQCLFSKMSDL